MYLVQKCLDHLSQENILAVVDRLGEKDGFGEDAL